MAKQAVKKGQGIKRPSIASLKASLGMDDLTKISNADKPMEWIVMPEAYQNALKLPGFPMGYVSVISGWSNTGKSTLKNCLIAACQRQGILPVIYETENNFDFKYAMDCGMRATPVYGDVNNEVYNDETGEVQVQTRHQIVDYDGDFLYFNSAALAEIYGCRDHATGKDTTKKRPIPVIEDVALSMNDMLRRQADGEIPMPICFIWDSVGSIPSYKSYTSKVGNNMFDAAAIQTAFNNILNTSIPSSRNVNAPYCNTFVCVNKIWNDSMNGMPGMPSIELKGGKGIFFAARLILHLGGVTKAATKKLTATAKGQSYDFGIITKIKATKNHLPTPYNITYQGTFCCLHNGIYCEADIDEYKKRYSKDLLAHLEQLSDGQHIDLQDVQFTESESED